VSRAISFSILKALRDALTLWREAPGYELADADWHMSSDYEDARSKILAMDDEHIPCLKNDIPKSFCRYPVSGRSEFLPRSNPVESSLRSIMKHGPEYFPGPQRNLYDPPDAFNPRLEVPAGAVDYLHIVENGVDFVPTRGRRDMVALRKRQLGGTKGYPADDAKVKPGIGWSLSTKAAADSCDGTYDSFCGRGADSECLLYGHNDDRGGIYFDGLSGWVVFKVEQVRYGAIVAKIEFWHDPNANPRTEGWTCENNDCAGRGLEENSLGDEASSLKSGEEAPGTEQHQLHRRLEQHCGDFRFEYAIDGRITSWDWHELMERKKQPKRNVDLWTLLDDPDFARDGEPKDVEVAMRVTGCARQSTFLLTHIYWH